MTKYLLTLSLLLAVGVAGAQPPEEEIHYLDENGGEWIPVWDEGEYFIETDPSTSIIFPACITTEFCGDPASDSDVRCVRATICGEPIR